VNRRQIWHRRVKDDGTRVSRSGEKKGRKYASEFERLTVEREFVAQSRATVKEKAIEEIGGRLVKRKHKQERQREMMHGQDCPARGNGGQSHQQLTATPPRFQ
jgi:hypothetical protein